MSLLARRQAIKDRHAILESVRESPWHSERMPPGEMLLSARPIAFVEDRHMRVVGPCVAQILAALLSYSADAEPHDNRTPQEERAWQLAVGLKAQEGINGPELVLSSQDWNDCLFALAHEGVLVCTSQGD